jgi:hypothetical protein
MENVKASVSIWFLKFHSKGYFTISVKNEELKDCLSAAGI